LKNLADVDILELRVNCPGNCYDCHAFWFEPAVTWK